MPGQTKTSKNENKNIKPGSAAESSRGGKKKNSVMQRLFSYALLWKKPILIALVLLAASVVADLSGPMLAKRMINVHILGIEKPWIVTDAKHGEVQWQGRWYVRSDRLTPGAANAKTLDAAQARARVLQVGRSYVFVPQAIQFDGDRSYRDGKLTIAHNGKTVSYPAQKLNASDIFTFYKPDIGGLLHLSYWYIGLMAVSAVLMYFQSILLQTTANRIIQKMRNDVFGQISRLPVRYFDHLPAGKVVSRITNDTEVVREMYVTVLASFFTGGVNMLGILIALFFLNIRLALFTLMVIPILGLWMMIYRKYAALLNHQIRSLLSDINGIINETIQGMPVIRAFVKERTMEAEFEELNEAHLSYQRRLQSLSAMTSHNLVGVIRNLSICLIIWYFGRQSFSTVGVISFGVLYAFVDYLNRLFQPMINIVNQLGNMEQARVSAERVFELMDEEGIDVADASLADLEGRHAGQVEFDSVYFAYNRDDYVLKDIDFKVEPGKTVALVGHTGSGKSSMINLLFRFYDVNRGAIKVGGVDIRDIPHQVLRKRMGIVLQDPFLFTGTIAENVSMQDPAVTRERIEQALREVGADSIIDRLTEGMDEPVLEKGSTLSAGQRQLISFARALAFDPEVLILDEATSNIDTETEGLIQRAMDVVKQGRTTFIIAHRLSTIKNADLILLLDRGEVVERGTHEALMQRQGKYCQMVQMQQGRKIDVETDSGMETVLKSV